jgi:hypothetical protein
MNLQGFFLNMKLFKCYQFHFTCYVIIWHFCKQTRWIEETGKKPTLVKFNLNTLII